MGRMALPQITWQDVLEMPEDGNRYEAIRGALYVTPPPSRYHQSIVVNLSARLHDLLSTSGLGRVWVAPFGVRFPSTGEGVQPDVVVVSSARREAILRPEGVAGAPDLVVEVLSPSTAHVDRSAKFELYRRQGVGEYWIIDPEAEAVDVYRFGAAETRHERRTDLLDVHLAGEAIGRIELADVFHER